MNDLDQFLMDLCDLAKSDASRHIGTNEAAFDRDDARDRRAIVEIEPAALGVSVSPRVV
jgi:hypothetical protein